MSRLTVLRGFLLPVILCIAPAARAQVDNAAADPEVAGEGWRALPRQIRGLLDIELPRLDPPGTFRLQFNPHFRDLLKRGYLRVPTGVRWTVDEYLELQFEAEAYFTHGLRSNQHGNGLGELRLGARRLLPRWPLEEFSTNVGLQLEFPVGSPPVDMTDGLNHVRTYIVTERRHPHRPRWTEFGGLSLDLVGDSSVAGSIGSNTPRDHALSLTGGVAYDQHPLLWTLQATATTTLIGGGDDHFFSINPSVIWFVPRRLTLNSRTQWLLGVGARSIWGPDGHEFSTGTRVRAEITFRQAMDRLRGKDDGRR